MVSEKKFSFREQLTVGARGEELFLESYGGKLSEDLRWDIAVEGVGTVELKTDMHNSPNFFIEYYSDKDAKTPGGPWKSRDNNVNYFVYHFLEHKTFYWFRPEDLIRFMKNKKYNEILIPNFGWTTLGYAVPIIDIAHLALQVDQY